MHSARRPREVFLARPREFVTFVSGSRIEDPNATAPLGAGFQEDAPSPIPHPGPTATFSASRTLRTPNSRDYSDLSEERPHDPVSLGGSSSVGLRPTLAHQASATVS